MDPRGQDLAGGVCRVEQGNAAGKGKMRERRDHSGGIYAAIEAVSPHRTFTFYVPDTGEWQREYRHIISVPENCCLYF